MLFSLGFIAMFTHRRAVRRAALDRARRHPADRHLLRRRALPLRAVRRPDVRRSSPASTTGGRRSSGACSTSGSASQLLDRCSSGSTSRSSRCTSSASSACRAARTATRAGMGWDTLNLIETIGAFIIALVGADLPREHDLHAPSAGPIAGDDPWDGRSLEWSIPSPPPEYNFAEIPEVEARDDCWHRKYTEDAEGRLVRLPGRRRRRRGTTRRSTDRRRRADRGRRAPTATASTCRRRRSTRWSSPSGCRSSGYAAVFPDLVARDPRCSCCCCSACTPGAIEPGDRAGAER